jgi:hypothetical protein
VDQHDRTNCHPRDEAPLFVPRLGYEQQRMLPALERAGVRMTVSPLYYMAANPELALFTGGEHQLGLALDPCAHHRQLPFERRSASFRSLPYGSAPQAFDPDRDAISADEFTRLATLPLELQRNRGATLMLTCAHLAGPAGSRGRELDLRLARAAIAHFRAQRMDEPPAFAVNPARREIYAALAIRARDLHSPAARQALVDTYLALAADGFWLKIEGFDERAPRLDIRCAAALFDAFREGGRPVLGDQAGQLHLGLLADGISATVGLAEGEHFRFPTDWNTQTVETGQRRGRLRSAYHPKLLRSFRIGGTNAMRAFSESPCPCRLHPGREAPEGTVVEAHAAVLRCAQAREALVGDRADRREWLLAAAAMATHIAHDAGVAAVPPLIFEELFAGLDRADEVQQSRAV